MSEQADLSSEQTYYVLHRRGSSTKPGALKAVVILAASPAHARVAVADEAKDPTWGDDGWTSCTVLGPVARFYEGTAK